MGRERAALVSTLGRVVFTLGLIVAPTTAQDGPRVTVKQGDLIGTTETFQESDFIGVNKTIDVFRGIPFAEPPVGPLRFEHPEPKQPWDGTYNATYFRSACIQDESQLYGSPMSEDCLHLNIYAPNPKPSGAAVMVWIHGGGYTVGTAIWPGYYGQPLVGVGDVIVVTINYRLNVFGFLTTGDDVLPGNLGLHDQILALQWINQNIAAFGGDNGRITIFGESAGSGSANMLLLSPKATGLFSQAILQSGTAFSPWSFSEDLESLRSQAFQIGEALGCTDPDSAALVNCLRGKNAMALYMAVPWDTSRFTPVVDNYILPDTPTSLYSTGRFNHATVLLGTNKDEGTMFVFLDPTFSEYANKSEAPAMSREVFDQFISGTLAYYGASSDLAADTIKMRYVDWSQADYSDADYFRAYVDCATDFNFACGTDAVARFHAQGGDGVFMYQMTHAPSVSYLAFMSELYPGWLGASHAEDLFFVFGVPFIPELKFIHNKFSDEEKALSVQFMEFWTNFAKTGNPGLKTPTSQPESDRDYWPRFTVPELEYKVLDLNLTTSRALKSDECHFWNSYFPQLLTMLAKLDVAEREWRQSFYTWKYTDMEDWREQFDQYTVTV